MFDGGYWLIIFVDGTTDISLSMTLFRSFIISCIRKKSWHYNVKDLTPRKMIGYGCLAVSDCLT